MKLIIYGEIHPKLRKLKWKAKTNVYDLAKEMITSDYNLLINSKKIEISKNFNSRSRRHGGKCCIKTFKKKNYKIINCRRKDLDFLDQSSVDKWFKKNKPNIVVNAAGRVGGILDNLVYQ